MYLFISWHNFLLLFASYSTIFPPHYANNMNMAYAMIENCGGNSTTVFHHFVFHEYLR